MAESAPTFSGLATRVATGLVLAALVALLITLAPFWAVGILAAAAAGIGSWEFEHMMLAEWGGPERVLTIASAGLLPLAALAGPSALAGAAMLGLLAGTLATIASVKDMERAITVALPRGWGLMYAGLGLGCLILVLISPSGRALLMYLITVVAAADAGAYFAGSRFGKHKLAPVLSPGKSWEGVAGGLALSGAAGAVFAGLFLPATGPLAGFLLALVLAAASVGGDLLESVLKRAAGVKDSGVILPGHGGILDRVDGFLLAGPVLLLLRELFWR